VDQPPEKPKKPVPKGRRWKNLNYDEFNRTFPRIGMRRLAARDDPEAKQKLAELKEYVWRNRRKRNYRYPGRYSPSKRKGAKFLSVMVPIDVHTKIRELSKFYKKSMSQILRERIEPFFDETYKQAELLARIEKNREKNSVSPYVDKPGR
jgi:hypothetical protein